ncbi:hypothetical protein BJV82DRAFT_23881 [Fennellomyces sp. T-0311]|nr:hypothetical protein BJV82DRAFT_23881 [Fennellomyces sp. T-0311]
MSSSLPLYVPKHKSTTLDELALNTILSSVYLTNGKRRFKTKSSELSPIANSLSSFLEPLFSDHDPLQLEWDFTSWLYTELHDINRLRPDILLHANSNNKLLEVGNGEVKRSCMPEHDVQEARACIREVSQRQLHLRI